MLRISRVCRKCSKRNELRTFRRLQETEDFDGRDVLYECTNCGDQITTRE
jgi:uncharacterized Zn finger protein